MRWRADKRATLRHMMLATLREARQISAHANVGYVATNTATTTTSCAPPASSSYLPRRYRHALLRADIAYVAASAALLRLTLQSVAICYATSVYADLLIYAAADDIDTLAAFDYCHFVTLLIQMMP